MMYRVPVHLLRRPSRTTVARPYKPEPLDKLLYDQAMNAMNRSQHDAARIILESLIEKHPDSGYVPRANIAIADAWYRKGDFKQAASKYRDFIKFFPNHLEVARAQLQIV